MVFWLPDIIEVIKGKAAVILHLSDAIMAQHNGSVTVK